MKNLKLEMKNQAGYTANKWSLGVSRGNNVSGQGHYGAGQGRGCNVACWGSKAQK